MPDATRAVLLDGLGTLVALRPPWDALVAILRAQHGLEIEPPDAERAFHAEIAYYRRHHIEGRDAPSLAELREHCAGVLARALPAAVGDALSSAQLTAAMLEALRFEAFPDAVDTLVGLRARGCRLVAVSNWDVSLSAVLRELGLLELLDDVVTSAEVGEPKPGSAIFEAALARAGVRPAEALHVGDSFELDVRGAHAAGVAAVLIDRSARGGDALQTRAVDGRARRGRRDTADCVRGRVPVIASLAQLLA